MRLILINIILLAGLKVFAAPVWIEFKNFDPVLEEVLFDLVETSTKNIVEWRRDFAFGFDKGVSRDGGIVITYAQNPTCFATRKITAYNIDKEKIIIQSVLINPTCIESYQEKNKMYGMFNSVLHEVACHALTANAPHTDWGLCREALSTDKLYWGSKHREELKQKLDIDFK